MEYNADDILLPLALTVIIDNRIRDPELIEFRRQGRALLDLFGIDGLPEGALREWFELREDDLRTAINKRGKNTLILRALSKFEDDIYKDNLFDAMVTISVSDKEYRREESELLKSAAMLWGYERPPIKVDE